MINKVLILLGASVTLNAATPQGPTLRDSMVYLEGVTDGSEMTVAAINAQLCFNSYEDKGQPPGPECSKFVETFERIAFAG